MTSSQDDLTSQTHPQIELTSGKRNAVLGAVMLGLFLSALDQTVVGTALPRIVTDLHGNGLYTWVVTSYLLSSTITVPIYGKLSDIYGRKPLLLIGVSVFLVGSWLSGLSHDMMQLIFFRGLQGLGAGALFPISLAIIGDLFTPRERGRYQGLFGAVFGLSFIVGPFIGGWITDNISWHWVFYVNMPIGLATLVVIATVLPNFHPNTGITVRDLDYAGIVLFTAGVVPLLLGLTNKGLTDSHGTLYQWTDPTVGGLILIGAVLLAIFLLVESKAKQPIIPLNLFRDRTYSATNLAVFLVAFGMFASVIFLPRYYQGVRGISATDSGYMIWPLLVGLIGSSIGTGILISKMGRYKLVLVAALAILVVGSFLMTRLTATSSNVSLWSWMLIMGLGIGPSMSGFTVVVQNSAPVAQLGAATSTLTFLRQIGGSVGLAIAGTLFSQSFTRKLPHELLAHGVPGQVVSRFGSGQSGSGQGNLSGVNLGAQLAHSLPAQLQPVIPRIVAGVHDAFSLAVGQVFWLTFGAAVLAFLAALLIADQPLRGRVSGSAEAANVTTGAEVPVMDESGGRVAAR
ncbi:MAG: MDR family MFS transporter [Chloroflexota bacterium]|nr:MAG: MFS transporter [Chloroflexota bacterium]